MSYQPKVLLLDNAPGHPANFSEVSTLLGVTVVYMPSNTTSLFQPEDQRLRAIFKACFLHQTFREMVRGLDSSDKTIKDCWRTFDILKGISNINTALEEVLVKSLNALWCKLLPEFVHDFTGFELLAAGWRKRWDWMRLHLKMWQSCWITMDSSFPMNMWKNWLKN
jgi:hypothetical protein